MSFNLSKLVSSSSSEEGSSSLLVQQACGRVGAAAALEAGATHRGLVVLKEIVHELHHLHAAKCLCGSVDQGSQIKPPLQTWLKDHDLPLKSRSFLK